MTFDHTGQHLATGDRGGRVVLFERVPTQPVCILHTLPACVLAHKTFTDRLCTLATTQYNRPEEKTTMFAAQSLLGDDAVPAAAVLSMLIMLAILQKAAGADQRATPASRLSAFEYRYLTEFQSHEPEFDYLKSLEIEEKINKVKWCRTSCGSRMLLSTNDKTIKLWRVRLASETVRLCATT